MILFRIYNYLFKKPKDVFVGDELTYYDYKVKGFNYSWEDGIWFIKCENKNGFEIEISAGLEKFYRKKK